MSLKGRASKAVTKYLSGHAEPEIDDLAIESSYDTALVIPAYRERAASIKRLILALPERCLIILVINAPRPDPATLDCLQTLRTEPQIAHGRWWTLHRLASGHSILIFDYCTGDHCPPTKQGVGLARKLGADAALMLFADGTLATDQIYLTDADARLPSDYLTRSWPPSASGVVFPFRHSLTGSAEQKTATLLFECRLHHYTSGLAFAKSRYAFPTLGSLIGVRAEAYAKVRGVPKRSAGEDFYLLNKLAKVGDVVPLRGQAIRLSNRQSNRVPIGTGPAMHSLVSNLQANEWPTFYAPASFQTLGLLLSALNQITLPQQLGELQDPAIKHYIESTQLVGQLSNLQQSTPSHTQFQRAVDAWFDGFRQLKFIHFLRDHWHPQVPLNQVLEAPWFHTPNRASMGNARYRQLQQLALAQPV